MPSVAILGCGELGMAMGGVLENVGLSAKYWDRDPKKRSEICTLQEAFECEVVFVCVVAAGVEELLQEAKKLESRSIMVCMAKGIDGSGRLMSELFEDLCVHDNWALVYGPMLAEEIRDGMPVFGVVGSQKYDVFIKLVKMFKNTNLKLEYSPDVYGVALAGVLKNIYAVVLGIADGSGFGESVKGWLVAKSVKEMRIINMRMGGDEQGVMQTAALADFVATGFSKYSKNRMAGEQLAMGNVVSFGEGLSSVEFVAKKLGGNFLKLEIFKLIYESRSGKLSKDKLGGLWNG